MIYISNAFSLSMVPVGRDAYTEEITLSQVIEIIKSRLYYEYQPDGYNSGRAANAPIGIKS